MDLMCPMVSNGYEKRKCWGEKCAWWVGVCAVGKLAGQVAVMKEGGDVPVPEQTVQEQS
jgi:hypothetical protein